MPTTMRFRRDGVALHIHPVAGSSDPNGRWHGPWERHPSDPHAHEREDAEHPFIGTGRYPVAWERRELLLGRGTLSQAQIDTYFRALRGERMANTFQRDIIGAQRARGVVLQQEAVLEATTAALAFDQRRFGVEIECIMNVREFVRVATAKGLRVVQRGYNHIDSETDWKLVNDGSLRYSGGRAGFQTIELVSPILQGDEGMRKLQQACEALAETGAMVNRTCGLHVHHDASRNMDLEAAKRLGHSYQNAQPAIDKLVARSRRGHTTYCSSFTSGDLAVLDRATEIGRIGMGTRYKAVNFEAYGVHKTIEFRQHQGSVEFQKISAWVKLGQCLVAHAVNGGTVQPTSNVAELFNAIGLPTDLSMYFIQRVAVLAAEVS